MVGREEAPHVYIHPFSFFPSSHLKTKVSHQRKSAPNPKHIVPCPKVQGLEPINRIGVQQYRRE